MYASIAFYSFMKLCIRLKTKLCILVKSNYRFNSCEWVRNQLILHYEWVRCKHKKFTARLNQ